MLLYFKVLALRLMHHHVLSLYPPYGRLGENALGIKFALCCIMCKSIKKIYNNVMSTNDDIGISKVE